MFFLEAIVELAGGLANLGFGIIGTGIMFRLTADLVESLQECLEDFGDRLRNWWLRRKYSELHSYALELQSQRTR